MNRTRSFVKGRASVRNNIRMAIAQPLSLRYAMRPSPADAPARASFVASMRRQGWLLYYLLRDVSRAS